MVLKLKNKKTEYDNGNKKKRIDTDYNSNGKLAEKTETEYDALEKPISQIYQGYTGDNENTEAYRSATFNEDGVSIVKDKKGNVIKYNKDSDIDIAFAGINDNRTSDITDKKIIQLCKAINKEYKKEIAIIHKDIVDKDTIDDVIDNKLKVRSQYPSKVCYENLNFRLTFAHKFHPLYLEPQVKITQQFIGSVDYALASVVIDLKKYYILNSFTENQLEKEKYLYFEHQDPTFFGFSDHKKSIHSIHHLNGCITPKIMAYHWSNTCFKNDKYLSKNLIIQNWIADKNLKKKIILIQKFRRQVLIFLVLYKIYNFIVFFLFYKLKNLFKKIIFIVKIIIKKLLRSLVKIFNFSVYKI
jgi:hypothetical protein